VDVLAVHPAGPHVHAGFRNVVTRLEQVLVALHARRRTRGNLRLVEPQGDAQVLGPEAEIVPADASDQPDAIQHDRLVIQHVESRGGTGLRQNFLVAHERRFARTGPELMISGHEELAAGERIEKPQAFT
jgi:hypothetical protein